MKLRCMPAAVLLALAPTTVLAVETFETVDSLPYPSAGRFPAWPADPARPWTIFAYGGAVYDSNPLRIPSGEESDTIARLGVGGRSLTRIVGRQRLLLEGYGEYNDYADLNEIDHAEYGVRADWLWEIGNQTDGVVGYRRSKRLADLGEFRSLRRTMVSEERAIADGGYRFSPNWRIFAGLEHGRTKRDFDEIEWLNETSLTGSLTYRTPLANEIGGLVRATRGEARVEVPVDGDIVSAIDDFDEIEVAATVSYALGTQLRLGGRVGHTERNYEALPSRDFDGPTYRASVDWLPTTKLIFTLEGFRLPQSLADVTATHVVRQGASFGVRWAPTFKLVFTMRFINEDREYAGDLGALALGIQREDTLRTWRFGAGWEPLRHLQLGVGLNVVERTSNVPTNEYDYEQVMLNARWTF
jgi:Putative beta-barrel porin 2